MTRKRKNFRPTPGNVGTRDLRLSRKFFNQVINAANRASARSFDSASKPKPNSNFKGASARGAGVGGVARARWSHAQHQRRVVIKSRIVKLKSQSGAARAHLSYIQRDGVGANGEPAKLYNVFENEVSGADFDARCEGDRHQFRFIVAPEDGDKLKDMKPFIRDLMGRMEQDLGTELDWVAVDHYDTGHPHTHVVLRGKDHLGDDLVIAPNYISYGWTCFVKVESDFPLGVHSFELYRAFIAQC